jgi:hypothetical protein
MPSKTGKRKQRNVRKTRKMSKATKSRATGVIITRYYMIGCPACEMSKTPWEEFKQKSNVKVVEVESANLPPSAKVEAFPTYVVRKHGKETKRHQGAIMSSGEISRLL